VDSTEQPINVVVKAIPLHAMEAFGGRGGGEQKLLKIAHTEKKILDKHTVITQQSDWI
jgi:hypothetical protein